MTLEQQINALLAQAAPLRSSTDAYDDEALGDIINQINALRAKQAKEPAWPVLNEVVEGADALVFAEPEAFGPDDIITTENTRLVIRADALRKPGRPKKHS